MSTDSGSLTDAQQEMLRVVEAHAQAEQRGDLEAVMATLVPDPVYVIWGGLRIEGYDNVREFYRRMFESDIGSVIQKLPRMPRFTINTWVGESAVTMEAEIGVPAPDGEPTYFNVIATFNFRDGLALGEVVSCLPEHEALMNVLYPDYTDLATPRP